MNIAVTVTPRVTSVDTRKDRLSNLYDMKYRIQSRVHSNW